MNKMRTCQERHSNVLTKPVCLCRQEQLIREIHSVSGHMCTREPVSQHATGKRCRGTRAGRRLTGFGANTEPPWRHVMVSAPQAPGTVSPSPVCSGREGVETAGFTDPTTTCPLSKTGSTQRRLCVRVVFKLLLSALIGLSLMSKQEQQQNNKQMNKRVRKHFAVFPPLLFFPLSRYHVLPLLPQPLAHLTPLMSNYPD